MSRTRQADKDKFSLMIEELAQKTGESHIDTIIAHCVETGIEPESVKNLINKSLKEKLHAEAMELNYLKGGRSARL